MASTKLRSSCSFLNLLLSCLNFTLFILSSASIAPIILLKTPPSSLGYAFLVSSSISILSSFMGFYSQLTHFCFVTHLSLLLASLAGQLLSVLALFTKERQTLSMLKSGRDPREAKALVRVECGVFMAMFMVEFLVLVMSCGLHSCWVREYEGLEADRDETEKKRKSRRMARVGEESMVEIKLGEVKKEINVNDANNEKIKNNTNYGQWVKTDFEG
ncbi:hypothetical protein ACFE04_012260 [Oxalis oulophora]